MSYFFDTGDSQAISFGSYTHRFAVGLDPLPMQFGSVFNDRAIYYQRLMTSSPGPVVSAYRTSGTTTNACVPSISGTGTPSASAGTGFTVAVTSIEGVKTGLRFYGLDNGGFTPQAGDRAPASSE